MLHDWSHEWGMLSCNFHEWNDRGPTLPDICWLGWLPAIVDYSFNVLLWQGSEHLSVDTLHRQNRRRTAYRCVRCGSLDSSCLEWTRKKTVFQELPCLWFSSVNTDEDEGGENDNMSNATLASTLTKEIYVTEFADGDADMAAALDSRIGDPVDSVEEQTYVPTSKHEVCCCGQHEAFRQNHKHILQSVYWILQMWNAHVDTLGTDGEPKYIWHHRYFHTYLSNITGYIHVLCCPYRTNSPVY